MRIVCLSDTHGFHRQAEMPPGDVLVFAGDATNAGEASTYLDFNQWLKELPYKNIVAIAGNHDFGASAKCFSNATYLEDSGVEIDGVKFYGSPWTPQFFDWAFMLPRGGEELKAKWDAIPSDVGVLVTHGPPQGVLDQAKPGYSQHIGDELLAESYGVTMQPKLHVFGHIHGSYGIRSDWLFEECPTTFVNAAFVNEAYKPSNAPIVAEI